MEYQEIYELASAKNVEALKSYDQDILARALVDLYKYYAQENAIAHLADFHREQMRQHPDAMHQMTLLDNQRLERENDELQQRVDELEEEMELLQDENADMGEEMSRLRADVKAKHQGGRARYSQEIRDAVLYDYLDEMPQRSIAEKHGMSLNTVYRIIRDARDAGTVE